MNQAVSQTESKNNLQAEYEAIRSGVAVLEIPAGKLRLSGKNSVQFLNGLVSNDVKTLAAGDGVLAAFPTLQGKLAALCRIYNTGEYLLLELDAINREKIFKNLSRFVPAGEFFVTDASDELALLSLQGPQAVALVESLTSAQIDTTELKISEWQIAGAKVLIATHSRCGETGFDIFVEADAAAKVKQVILDGGAREVGEAAFEIARIEAGVPREGVDAGEEYIILESELESAVSYTKGCYLGQEVIARIHWRGQPAKRLRGLLIEGNEVPAPGTELFAVDGNMVGRRIGEITSAAMSFALKQPIALGYVHRYYLNAGTVFSLKQGDIEIGRAKLAELPFYQKVMEEEQKTETAEPLSDWNVESAEMAYGVIGTYVEHTQISGIMIALLASALGEERVAPIVQGEYWQAYMASKRNLTNAKEDIERLTALIEKVRGHEAPAAK